MIRIVQGNDVNIHVPLMEKNADGTTTPIDFANVSGLEVRLSRGSEAFNDFTIYTANNTVVICLNENAPVGAYSILIKAKNNGVDICYNEKCAFAIVTYNGDSTYIDYIADEDVTLDTALFVAAIVNDQQVEELRQELRQKISEAEQSKDEYDQAAENLVEVAEDLGDISQTVEDAVVDAMQGADVAKQGTDPTATLTAVKQILDNLDISQVAKQGTDPTATNTAILAAIAAIATAVGLIPTNPATSTDVSNAQTAIIGAMPSVSGLASETSVKDGNDTAISLLKDGSVGLAAIKALVQAISGYALQGSDPTATNTAIKQTILDNAGTPQMTIPNTTASQELAPNTVYLFENRTNNLTLTLGTPLAGQNNEYHFFVVVGATAPTLTYPVGISWNGGSAPTIATGKTYEFSINNNVAAYFEI